ncbi:MAG: hypothetical protein ACREXP_00465 [Steroidobacteraceae bacterium]
MQLRPFLLDLGALALIVLAPLVVLLSFHGYSYFTPEVLLVLASTFAVAALLAVLIGVAGRLVRAIVLAGLIALFIDMHVDLPPWPSVVITLLFLAAVAALAAVLSLLREHATTILSVIFVTLIALTFVRGNPNSNRIASERTATAASGNAEPPLLIHLLLDEHIGVEGLPPEIPGARALRPELIDFYTSRGFRLFGGAYSQYANTFNSIANLLNFASREVSHPYLRHETGEETEWNLKQAAYFQMLQQRGYRLHVYQSKYMDLCHADGVQVQECTTYPVTSLSLLEGLGLGTAEKARAIANAIITQSNILRVVNKVYERLIRGTLLRAGWQLPAWRWQKPLFGSLPVPDVFERLSDDILRHPRGHAFFAHLLMPHYPYIFDRRCKLRPHTSDWLTNRIASTDLLVYNTVDSRAQKYGRYAEQVRCMLTLIDGLLDDLESRGLLDQAIIVVNGDHGSRIPLHYPSGLTLARGVLTDSDLSDSFSALYAIHAPGVSPGYDAAPLTLVELLNHHLGGEPLNARSSCTVFVVEEKGGSLTGVAPKFCAP